jgi:hypothetical protein
MIGSPPARRQEELRRLRPGEDQRPGDMSRRVVRTRVTAPSGTCGASPGTPGPAPRRPASGRRSPAATRP